MMTTPTAPRATPPLSLLAFLGDVAIFTLVALATERAEAEFAIAGAATSDDTIRPAIRNFRRISNIPFEKEFGHRYHCHCDHARKLSRERMGAAKKHALCCDCSKLFLNNPAVGTFKRHRAQDAGARSEEPTSELQPLMRTSHAVFC